MSDHTFTTQQMAEQSGLSAHTLRYYEKIGLLLDIARDANGYRRYQAADLEWVAFLRELKATGMPLEQMKRFARLRQQGNHTAGERRHLLETHRQQVQAQIERLHHTLTVIDHKIERHKNMEKESNAPIR